MSWIVMWTGFDGRIYQQRCPNRGFAEHLSYDLHRRGFSDADFFSEDES